MCEFARSRGPRLSANRARGGRRAHCGVNTAGAALQVLDRVQIVVREQQRPTPRLVADLRKVHRHRGRKFIRRAAPLAVSIVWLVANPSGPLRDEPGAIAVDRPIRDFTSASATAKEKYPQLIRTSSPFSSARIACSSDPILMRSSSNPAVRAPATACSGTLTASSAEGPREQTCTSCSLPSVALHV